MSMGPSSSPTFTIETRLISPSASDFSLSSVPTRVCADRPLELELAAVGLGVGAGTAESVASWISAHAILQTSVEVPGQPRGDLSLLIKARPSGSIGFWLARALVRPSAWANATSVSVVSLSLAGESLPCDCLPATLQVGYNHAPAITGAVFAAVLAGDVLALQAALDSNGSTEESDEVRHGVGVRLGKRTREE